MLRIRTPSLGDGGGGPTPQELAAEAVIAITADAALSVGKPLAAEAVIAVTADAALSVGKLLAAEATIAVTADAALLVRKPLAAEATIAITADADLSTASGLAAEATIAITADAALSVGKTLAAEAALALAVDAALAVGKPLAAEAAIAIEADAALSVAKLLAAEAVVGITADAALSTAANTTEIPVRTAIIDAVMVALNAASMTVNTAPVTVERARTDAVDASECPLLAVVGGDMDAIEGDTMYDRYSLRLVLAGYLSSPSEAAAERDAAELHARVVRALVRPDPAALPVPLLLADGLTEIWLRQGALRVDPASVLESETPAAACVIEMFGDVSMPTGNLFVTA
jgi:hypothetical protein